MMRIDWLDEMAVDLGNDTIEEIVLSSGVSSENESGM
jgi:hypothetical protein